MGTAWASRDDHYVCRPCELALRRAGRAERLDDIEQMWNAGMPIKDIAKVLGRGRYTGAIGPELAELRRLGRIGYRYKAYESSSS